MQRPASGSNAWLSWQSSPVLQGTRLTSKGRWSTPQRCCCGTDSWQLRLSELAKQPGMTKHALDAQEMVVYPPEMLLRY